MKSALPYRASTRIRFSRAVVPGAAVLIALVLFGGLWWVGAIDVSRLFAKPERSTAGLVPVPVAPRTVRNYTKISRDDFWDPKNNRLSVIYLPPNAVSKEMLTQLSDILGRVLNHEKAPGFAFTESDFFPRGTREGIVAGIPPGKRAIRVPAEKVEGFYDLHPGDRFDLLATIPISGRSGAGAPNLSNVGGVYGQQLALQAQLTNWQRQATVHVMVQNGVVVQPMTTRQVPVFQNTLTQGGVTRMRPVQEIVIAIEPDEVAELTQAMAVDAKISVVPRSGRPGDAIDSVTPDLRPVSPFAGIGAAAMAQPDTPDGVTPAGRGAPFRMVETISGRKRELTAVPR
jgi:Flp pilus assembly protein CpaB